MAWHACRCACGRRTLTEVAPAVAVHNGRGVVGWATPTLAHKLPCTISTWRACVRAHPPPSLLMPAEPTWLALTCMLGTTRVWCSTHHPQTLATSRRSRMPKTSRGRSKTRYRGITTATVGAPSPVCTSLRAELITGPRVFHVLRVGFQQTLRTLLGELRACTCAAQL